MAKRAEMIKIIYKEIHIVDGKLLINSVVKEKTFRYERTYFDWLCDMYDVNILIMPMSIEVI